MSTGFGDFSLTAHICAPSARQLYMINISKILKTTLNNPVSYFHVHNEDIMMSPISPWQSFW